MDGTLDELQRIKQKVEASSFAGNNGAMIRVINILEGDWIRLSAVQAALSELDAAEWMESLSYLQKEGYIAIRYIHYDQSVDASKADPKKCEVSLTSRGMRLARYIETDPAVQV
jgi:hypothetical protein